MLGGLAFTFGWEPLVHHQGYWAQPGDIWGAFHSSQIIGWGDLGDIYTPGTGFIATPGLPVLMVPIAMIASHWNLSESFPWANGHPSVWPLLATFDLVCGAAVLVVLDHAAQFLSVSPRRRFALSCLQATILWPVIVVWGHPEDAIALGFAVAGLLGCFEHRWRRSGWLFGLALLFQPFTLLMAPFAFAGMPKGQRLRFLARVAVPVTALLLVPLGQSWHNTTFALVDQPTFPGVNHPTPLLSVLAIQLSPESADVGTQVETRGGVGDRFMIVHHTGRPTNVVAPGPGRLIALIAACGLGFFGWRRRFRPQDQMWLAAVALGAWSVLEPVMTPYYLWPPLAIGLLLSFRADWWRVGASCLASLFAIYWSERVLNPWEWWLPLIAALLIVLVCGYPLGSSASRPDTANQKSCETQEDELDELAVGG